MTSEAFKAAIRAGNFEEALIIAVGKAVELQITSKVVDQGDRSQTYLQSHLDLVGGKFATEVGQQTLNDTTASALQQFHQAQLSASNRLIRSNLESLQQMFAILGRLSARNRQQFQQQLQRLSEQEQPPVIPSIAPTAPEATAPTHVPETSTEPEPPEAAPESQPADEEQAGTYAQAVSQVEVMTPEAEEDWGDWLEEGEAESEAQAPVESTPEDWGTEKQKRKDSEDEDGWIVGGG